MSLASRSPKRERRQREEPVDGLQDARRREVAHPDVTGLRVRRDDERERARSVDVVAPACARRPAARRRRSCATTADARESRRSCRARDPRRGRLPAWAPPPAAVPAGRQGDVREARLTVFARQRSVVAHELRRAQRIGPARTPGRILQVDVAGQDRRRRNVLRVAGRRRTGHVEEAAVVAEAQVVAREFVEDQPQTRRVLGILVGKSDRTAGFAHAGRAIGERAREAAGDGLLPRRRQRRCCRRDRNGAPMRAGSACRSHRRA